MRVFAFALATSLLAGNAAAAPARVASLNLCTDELLLMLGTAQQIASVTHLSHKPAETPLWRQARRYPANDGSLVSIIGRRPDLVLTMGGGGRDRAGVAGRLGIRTLDLPYPQTIADVEKAIKDVASALGHPVRAQPMLAAIGRLKRNLPAVPAEAVWLGGGGRSVAPDSLAGQWMRLAGLRQRRLSGNRMSLEQLLVRPPAILLRSTYRIGEYSSEQQWLSHPLAAKAKAGRTIDTDGRRWTCMGPALIPEINRLRSTLR